MKTDIPNTLLAKSYDSLSSNQSIPAYAKLLPHLRAVERAGKSICEIAGELILKQLNLPIKPWLSRLHRTMSVACLCHDIGKANESFQQMVRGNLNPKLQPARHELLSALLLIDKDSPLRQWALKLLKEGEQEEDNELLLNCVIGAVAGHHLKMDLEWKKAARALQGGCGTRLKMLLNHQDLKPLFKKCLFKEEISFSLIEGESRYIGDSRLTFQLGSNYWFSNLKQNQEWRQFAATIKSLVAAADVAGSAMLPENENIKNWVSKTLSQRISSNQMRDVVKTRLKNNKLRNFQRLIGESKNRVTLVEAGCGSGKTLAAYHWATYHAAQKKLFFCYPTTGTATEGFLGYVHESDIESKLTHSRSFVDLEGITKVIDEEKDEHLLKIDSLNIWSPKVIICTVDTVLSLVRNNRRGLYNSPAILSGSFVFDELHSYDNKMFEAIIALIKVLPGASFLLMTASLPKFRKEFLLKNIENIHQIPPIPELEDIPRYYFYKIKNEEDAFQEINKSKNLKKRILWICNTVARAQSVFQKLKFKGIRTKTYHSRYKYQDRVSQHRDIVEAFNNEKQKFEIVAVTTQVAEMSLDLDADILISEMAPIPSLIQRLGRLNRRVTQENKQQPRNAYFITPESILPYKKEELDLTEQWLSNLIELQKPLSQSDLSRHFNQLSPEEYLKLDTRTAWLDSSWFATPEQIRESGYSVSVIMEEDENICQQNTKELTKRAIPMNYNKAKMDCWKEFKGHLIAPTGSIDYDTKIGAKLL